MKRSKLSLLVFVIVVFSSVLIGGCHTPKAPGTDDAETEYNENLCTEDEEILISFKTENSDKVLSVCISKTAQEYIVYRFGTKEKAELDFPVDKADSWSKFIYSYYLRGGGKENEGMDNNYLTFENGGYEYKIYQEYAAVDESTAVGVIVKDKSTNKETDIKGLPDTLIGSLVGLRSNDKIQIES